MSLKTLAFTIAVMLSTFTANGADPVKVEVPVEDIDSELDILIEKGKIDRVATEAIEDIEGISYIEAKIELDQMLEHLRERNP